ADERPVVVGQLPPLGLELPGKLIPLALDYVPVHRDSPFPGNLKLSTHIERGVRRMTRRLVWYPPLQEAGPARRRLGGSPPWPWLHGSGGASNWRANRRAVQVWKSPPFPLS